MSDATEIGRRRGEDFRRCVDENQFSQSFVASTLEGHTSAAFDDNPNRRWERAYSIAFLKGYRKAVANSIDMDSI